MDNEELIKSAQSDNQPNRIDRAIQKFADLMIERMEACKDKSWEQGWTGGYMGLPQNIKGWTYVGGNAFLLQVHTLKNDYHVPVYMTAKQARENGALIKKGESSIPVFKWGLRVKDENGKRMSEEKYLHLPKEEQQKCQVRPYLKVFPEWNIDQTTLEETNKKKYDAILSRFQSEPLKDAEGMYKSEPLDRMFSKQEWLCPIRVDKEASGASYSPTDDSIVVPKKEQFKLHDTPEEVFKDGQEYYSTALHEMAHSTGHSSRLDRITSTKFGSDEYAKEELVAETTAFIIGTALGFSSRISDNDAAYIDHWIQKLKQEPRFIVSVMSDVNKSSRMILEQIDVQKRALGESLLLDGNLDGIDEQLKNEEQLAEIKQQEEEKPVNTQKQEAAPPLSSPKAYFTALIGNITADQDSEHSVLEVENLDELRAYYQGNDKIGTWIETVSDEELLAAGANLLPKIQTTATQTVAQPNSNMTEQNISEESKKEENKPSKTHYFSYQFLQSTDDTQEFDKLQDQEKWDELLSLAKELDSGDALSQREVYKDCTHNIGDSLLVENEEYAIVYNNSVGGTYELLRKVSEQDIKNAIDSYGLEPDASQAVMEVVKDMTQKEMEKSYAGKMQAFSMPNDDVLYFQYNKEKDTIELGSLTNIGLSVHHQFPYNHEMGIDENLQNVYEYLSELPAYQAIQEEETQEEKENVVKEEAKEKQQTSAHEDSNIQTDVVGKAEQIAATGVPMAEAEKEAKAIVDDEQHETYHNEKDKETAQQQEDAAKQQEEEKKQEASSKAQPASHAAILLGALALAKNQNGVWMNAQGKSNAEFLNSKKPITAFNNIMMNLESDLQGYKTNIYTSYEQAKKDGISVKRGQTSLPFNWTQWEYQNVANPTDIISRDKYNALPDADKPQYAVHATRQRHHVYNIDQTVLPSIDSERYGNLVRGNGQQIERFGEKVTATSEDLSYKMVKQFEEKHPDSVILVKNNNQYETFGEKAQIVSKVIGLPTTEKDIAGEKVSHIAFPSQHLDNVLPRIIRAGHRIAVSEGPHEAKLSQTVPRTQTILSGAYHTAETVAKASDIKYERVMVLQDPKFDSKKNSLTVSGMSPKDGNAQVNAIEKANAIYREVVASTGDEKRLDRSGRNNLLPDDDKKHELLIRELAAGVLMARQGLPATLSKESQELIPYWERELKENSKMMGMVERDVNNAIETIDNLLAQRKVNYKAIQGQLPSKDMLSSAKEYSISNDLSKLPSMESKEMVVVMDRKNKTADVILPSGASLLVDNEVQGMNKKRIAIALKKENIQQVGFYNAGGSLALKEPNSYYKDKEVTVSKLKQFTLETHQVIEVAAQAQAQKKEAKIEKFQAIQDDKGKYAFFIKPENEASFSIYPTKEHLNSYFSVMGKDTKPQMHKALAQKYYEMATMYPDSKQQLIMPNTEGIDMSKIEKVRICANKENPKEKVVIATIGGERMQSPISKQQWYNLWLADDMAAYKKAVAAVTFTPNVKQEVGVHQNVDAARETTPSVEKAAEQKEVEHAEQTAQPHKSFHR